jgi:translation initiation factor IF-3
MQVISDTGENLGVLPKSKALDIAQDRGLDLVLLSESGKEDCPVAKIMDFGKALYAKKKQQMQAKKKQAVIQVKEVRLNPKIGDHDFQTKMKQAISFLKAGKHLKINVMFKGREAATKEERGKELFEKIEHAFEQAGIEKLMKDKESKAGRFWTRIYYTKK